MDDVATDLVDRKRRRLLVRATSAAGGLALAGATYPFLESLAPSERARAQGGPVEVDLTKIAPGALATVEWRGKPVWVIRRTREMLERLQAVRAELTDPDSQVSSQQPKYAANAARSIRPEIFVSVGVCTHLGCVPSFRPAPDSLQPSRAAVQLRVGRSAVDWSRRRRRRQVTRRPRR